MSRILLMLSMAFLLTGTSGQPVQIWLDTVTGCAGDTIEIALKTNDFYQVGSLTLYVNYDPNALSYDTTTQLNPQVPGMLVNTIYTGQHSIAFSWFSTTMIPSNLGMGTLAVMRFVLLSENTSLSFNPQSEITNIVGQPLQTQFTGCTVVKKPVPITQQPQNCTSVPGGMADFSLQTSAPGILYRWEYSSDQTLWNDVTNDQHHSGSSTNQLTIINLNSSFNNLWYRCRLTMGNCTGYSDSALLAIDTTQSLISMTPESVVIRPYPNPFNNYLIIPLHGLNYKTCTFKIHDLSGRLLLERYFTEPTTELNEILISDLTIPSGYYLSTIIIDDKNNKVLKLKYPIISK